MMILMKLMTMIDDNKDDMDDLEYHLHTVELLLESNRTGSWHCCPHSNHDDDDDDDSDIDDDDNDHHNHLDHHSFHADHVHD